MPCKRLVLIDHQPRPVWPGAQFAQQHVNKHLGLTSRKRGEDLVHASLSCRPKWRECPRESLGNGGDVGGVSMGAVPEPIPSTLRKPFPSKRRLPVPRGGNQQDDPRLRLVEQPRQTRALDDVALRRRKLLLCLRALFHYLPRGGRSSRGLRVTRRHNPVEMSVTGKCPRPTPKRGRGRR